MITNKTWMKTSECGLHTAVGAEISLKNMDKLYPPGDHCVYDLENKLQHLSSMHTPGGPLVFQGGYHPGKKIHVIRVIFQDQTMYARTSFRVSKTC